MLLTNHFIFIHTLCHSLSLDISIVCLCLYIWSTKRSKRFEKFSNERFKYSTADINCYFQKLHFPTNWCLCQSLFEILILLCALEPLFYCQIWVDSFHLITVSFRRIIRLQPLMWSWASIATLFSQTINEYMACLLWIISAS